MDSNYKNAICTHCDAEIKLDIAKDQSFCSACGSKIDAEEAVLKFAMLFPGRTDDKESTVEVGADFDAPFFNVEPIDTNTPPEDDEDSLPRYYAEAKKALDARDYHKAADIYKMIINDISPDEHAAYWGLFMVDERNFNVEEKLLQCFSCFPFRTGADSIRSEVLGNYNLEKALGIASPEECEQYKEAAKKHADNIYEIFKEGIDNLETVIERSFTILSGTFETVGITSLVSRIGYPAGVGIKYMTDKYYFRFQTNKTNLLYLDVLSIIGNPLPEYELWHYKHSIMNPESGVLGWLEFRVFRNCAMDNEINGELNSFHKASFVLLGLWQDKMIIRKANKVFFCAARTQPEEIQTIFQRCYDTVCTPLVEDPNSMNTGYKSSEYYQVPPINVSFESNKKSRWLRKKAAGACYIATAVYGGYDKPEVMALRHFRDDVLMKSALGRAFVRAYYAISPPLAKRLKAGSAITRFIRKLLDKIVSFIYARG